MIDKSNEIFTHVKNELQQDYPSLYVVGEYVDTPSQFPCVTLDETSNIPTHKTNSNEIEYASVQYRVQVFSNSATGKRKECRDIFSKVDSILYNLGLYATSYMTTPTNIGASIYQITAIYNGVIDKNGYIFRR